MRTYQLHLAARGLSAQSRNQAAAALRFFIKITLGRREIEDHTQFVSKPRKLPVVLGRDEVARLLSAAPGLKYKAALSVAYGAGLRVSEVATLKSLPPRRRGYPTSTVPA